MEIRVLRYFLAAAREGSITAAAEFLHITQPTLSRQLSDLEDELGVKLFDRGSRKIRLTREGLLLKRSAEEIVELEAKARAQFLSGEEELAGEISFGCGELKSVTELAALMAEFRRANPNVTYRVFSGNADDIKDKVDKGLLDFALLVEPVDVTHCEFIRMKTKEKWTLLVPEESPLAQKMNIAPEDLAGRDIITTSRESMQNQLANWLGPCAKDVRFCAEVNLPYNASVLVKSGMGLFLCLDLECSWPGMKAVPLSPALEFGSVIAWKKDVPQSRAAEAFAALLRERLKVT